MTSPRSQQTNVSSYQLRQCTALVTVNMVLLMHCIYTATTNHYLPDYNPYKRDNYYFILFICSIYQSLMQSQ